MQIFKRRTKPGWMAVVLQAQHCNVVHLRRDGGTPRLTLVRRTERSGSARDTLAQLRRSLHLQHHRCTALLGSDAYQVVQVTAPAVAPEELRAAARWSVKDALDFPAESASIDVLLVPADGAPAGRAPLALVIAARRERVAEQVQAFQEAGLALHVIEVAETAQRNVAALFEQDRRGLALLAWHAHGALLTFTRGGELFASRHIDVLPGELHDSADAERRHALFERVGLEMQRSLDSFDRQFSQIAVQRLVVFAPSACDALLAYLRDNLYLPVDAGDLGTVLDLADWPELQAPGEQAAWLLPIGLALREDDAALAPARPATP